jgi:general secretion pathway protein M
MSKFLSNVEAWLATLSERERRLVGIGSIALSGFVVFLLFFGFSSSADAIRGRTQTKAARLNEVRELAAGYGAQKAAQDEIERQLAASNVRLASFLEQLASDTGVALPSITPKPDQTLEGSKIVESAVEVTITDVKLSRLIEFMNRVESGPGMVKIKYLRLEPRVAQETVTAWLNIATYHSKG